MTLIRLGVPIVRISNFNVLESFPEQLAFELKYVPDGSYGLALVTRCSGCRGEYGMS